VVDLLPVDTFFDQELRVQLPFLLFKAALQVQGGLFLLQAMERLFLVVFFDQPLLPIKALLF
jgi:hypothetical protein